MSEAEPVAFELLATGGTEPIIGTRKADTALPTQAIRLRPDGKRALLFMTHDVLPFVFQPSLADPMKLYHSGTSGEFCSSHTMSQSHKTPASVTATYFTMVVR